jgi:hypothetical protein
VTAPSASLIGDKAYDFDHLRDLLRSRGTTAPVAAGPAYLDEPQPKAGHSGFGEEALAYPKPFSDLGRCKQAV